MNRSSHSWALVAALLAFPIAGTAVAGNDLYQPLDGDRVRVITRDGKPPFRQRIVRVQDLSPAEFARFEETRSDVAATGEGKVGRKVRVVERGGKPPFSQRVETVIEDDASEFARFEEGGPDAGLRGTPVGDGKQRVIDRSGKPPFSQRIVPATDLDAAAPAREDAPARR
ncbi:MAG: hypothetical protein MUF07_16380 [Steroidobacteraceae bacterium]|jgi:hypothetical protein|nr:hypothetical protein [Steroidobacteraceae bacterium]